MHEFCSIYYLNSSCKQRDCKNFHNRFFHEELESKLNKLGAPAKNVNTFQFTMFWINIPPPKQKYLRSNQVEFMETELNHAIMFSSELRYQYLKKRKHDPLRTRRYISSKETLVWISCGVEKVLWKSWLYISDNKCFESHQSQKSDNLTLTEGSKVITDDEKCANIFNSYFDGVVK